MRTACLDSASVSEFPPDTQPSTRDRPTPPAAAGSNFTFYCTSQTSLRYSVNVKTQNYEMTEKWQKKNNKKKTYSEEND